jgi:GTP-binding protein
MGELLDAIYVHFPRKGGGSDDDIVKVAVIGKPNAGKSSIITSFWGRKRVIVSDIPGTTRDAIDTFLELNGKKYNFIDTAGIRRKSKIEEDIEKYSIIRSWAAVDRADVCIIMIDAQDGVTEQDTKIAGYAHEQGKAVIIAVNKWIWWRKTTVPLREYRKKSPASLEFMNYAPMCLSLQNRAEGLSGFLSDDYVFDQASLEFKPVC